MATIDVSTRPAYHDIVGTPLAKDELETLMWTLAPVFWDKKFKIALLTLGTYAAMC